MKHKIALEDSVFSTKSSLNCNGKLMDISIPKVMGILNATPDSFYAVSRKMDLSKALASAEKMIEEGVDIIDVGGYSSRPNAADVKEEEELKRVIPLIQKLHESHPKIPISIDSFRSKVCREAVGAGACIINDISAGAFDEKLFDTVAELNVPYILMHMQGKPSNMQKNPTYEDVLGELLYFFSSKIEILRKKGVKDILLDPGFGFGKNMEHNYMLLKNLKTFSMFGLPVLAGMSRKGMVWKLLDLDPSEALNGTTVVNTLALIAGAKILRVHDVKQAKETIEIVSYWQKQ